MICLKCQAVIDDDSIYCKYCGRHVAGDAKAPAKKQRGNGEGTVYKLPNGKYRAAVTLGYYTDDTGKQRRKVRTKSFDRKKDAVAALATLGADPEKKDRDITFKQLYDKWLPTHKAGKDTLNCYKSAIKYFEPVWFSLMRDIDIDDLQECIDECPHGKRTKENMRAVCGLVYKYGIPRHYIPENLNLAPFLIVTGDSATHRESFTPEQIEQIKDCIGVVYGADYVYCLIYLGFRPSEFLNLVKQSYDIKRQLIIGGSKTEAGINRMVTVSPKIQEYMAGIYSRAEAPAAPLICDSSGKAYTLQDFSEKVFYPVLDAAGIDNPKVSVGKDIERHKFTPHSCRHTFATLLKRVSGADKDKLELIGHTSTEMLRYYQDTDLADLRKITDCI